MSSRLAAILGQPHARPALLKDNFVGANGVLLPAHAMDVGTGWRADSNAYQLNGAGAAVQADAVAGAHIVSADSGRANATGQVSIVYGAGNTPRPGIAFRIADGANHWDTSLYQAGSAFLLNEVVAGVVTQRASYTLAVVNGATYVVKVQLSGTSIYVSLNGALVFTYTGGSGVGVSRWGLSQYNDQVSTFSQFKVTP